MGYGESCLVGQGGVLRIGGCPVPIPLGAQPGFGNQPHYEVPGDLWVEIVKHTFKFLRCQQCNILANFVIMHKMVNLFIPWFSRSISIAKKIMV